jgi:transposase-like protein
MLNTVNMEKLKIKIEKCITDNADKGFISHGQLADLIIEVIKNHKEMERETCPRCMSTRRKTFTLGFHHICKDCNFNY